MSVRMKILAACLGFVAIIGLLGVLAQQQAGQMGRLAIGIFDHAFMGMSYVNQAQNEFLRLKNSQEAAGEAAGATGDLQKVLSLLDVALDRAASDNARDAGKKTRGLLAALKDVPASELTERMTQADRSLTKLVQKFAADGLEARDDADEAVGRSTHIVAHSDRRRHRHRSRGWLCFGPRPVAPLGSTVPYYRPARRRGSGARRPAPAIQAPR